MVTVQRTKEQVYSELGDRIFDEIPYVYNEDEVPDIDATRAAEVLSQPGALDDPAYSDLWKQVLVDGPAKEYGGKDSTGRDRDKVKSEGPAVSEASMRDRPWESLWWSFNGGQYRVTKALMIPYTMTNDKGLKQTRHFLIGFMGVDSNGG